MTAHAAPIGYGSSFQAVATSSRSNGTVSPSELQLVQPSQEFNTSYDEALSFPMPSHMGTYPHLHHEDQRLFDQYFATNPQVDGVKLEFRTGIDTSEARFSSHTFPSDQDPDAHLHDL